MLVSLPLPSRDAAAVEIIRHYGWLASCPDWFQAWMLEHLQWRAGAAGTQINQGGEPGDRIWCVADGQIGFVSALGSAEIGHSFFGYGGTWWGQGPIFGMPYQISAFGRTDYLIGSASVTEIKAWLAKDPRGWEHFGNSVTDMQRITGGAHQDQLLPDSRRRVAAALLRLSGRRYTRYPILAADEFMCTQEELARASALSRNTAGRIVREMEEEGVIDIGYASIRIHDAARVTAIADTDTDRT